MEIVATNWKIKMLMEAKGINQCELAKLTGVSEACISQLISAKKFPSVSTLQKISNYLECSLDELV